MSGCQLRVRRAGRGNSASQDDTHRAQSVARLQQCVGPASAIILCGILAGSSQSQGPCCVQCPGLCGRLHKGSIRASFLPVSAAERAAGSGPASLRMPTQSARQTKGWRGGWGQTAQCLSPHPGRAEASAAAGHGRSRWRNGACPSRTICRCPPEVPKLQGHPFQFLLNRAAAASGPLATLY